MKNAKINEKSISELGISTCVHLMSSFAQRRQNGTLAPLFWPSIGIGALGLLTLTMKGEKKQNGMKKDSAERGAERRK